jgi:hypothetical protein
MGFADIWLLLDITSDSQLQTRLVIGSVLGEKITVAFAIWTSAELVGPTGW